MVTDKATVISNVKNKAGKLDSLSMENLKVQVYGDTAVANAMNAVKGIYKGKDVSGKYMFTDTWIKLGVVGNAWRLTVQDWYPNKGRGWRIHFHGAALRSGHAIAALRAPRLGMLLAANLLCIIGVCKICILSLKSILK